jgi:hypothetical protein
LLGASFLLLAVQPAYANNLPAPFPYILMMQFIMTPLTVGLTAFGGGYAVMAKRRELNIGWQLPDWLRVTRNIILGVFIVPLSYFTWPVIEIWAAVRAVQLIYWGVRKRKQDPPLYLADASSNALIVAGIVLAITIAAHLPEQTELANSMAMLNRPSFELILKQLRQAM